MVRPVLESGNTGVGLKDLMYVLKRAGWAPALVFLAHMILWHGVGAYEALPLVDLPMHFLGGLAIAFFLWTAYSAYSRSGTFGRPNAHAIAVLTLTSTATCAVLWEFAEYLSDGHLGTNTQKGLEETLLDMLLGIIGGAVFVGIAWFRQGRGDRSAPEWDHD